ncbi:MAG: nucleotidyltransferase domain-containing protein [Candidatus Cloacimonetes bacterium]|nr:nucleotidyltransferase domain-containing protein [Candidatus Cloacimonadota bacterium]
MTHQEYLLHLAQRNVAIYTNDPNVKAIALGGSLPLGRGTAYSDIDMLLMYDDKLDYDRLQEACAHNGGERRQLLNESEEACLEIYYVGGVECQFSHAPVSFYSQQIELLLVEHSLEQMPHLVADGMLGALPLHGEAFLAQLLEPLRTFPDELAVKMVEANVRPLPAAELRHRIMRERDLLRFYAVMPKTLEHMLKTLLGLNRQYIQGEWKRLDLLTDRLTLAPVDLLNRMNTAMQSEQYAALDILDALWRETVELVRRHMSEVDLTEADKRLNYTVKPIELPEQKKRPTCGGTIKNCDEWHFVKVFIAPISRAGARPGLRLLHQRRSRRWRRLSRPHWRGGRWRRNRRR